MTIAELAAEYRGGVCTIVRDRDGFFSLFPASGDAVGKNIVSAGVLVFHCHPCRADGVLVEGPPPPTRNDFTASDVVSSKPMRDDKPHRGE